jgi:hypothetical protein
MNLKQSDSTRRRIVSTIQWGSGLVLALLVAACTVTGGHSEKGTDTILYAPRLLQRIADPSDFYPDASKRAHETGEVVLHFRIGADGMAKDPFVVDEAHSTAPRLVKAAEQLLQLGRFETGEGFRRNVTGSVLFEIMPCGKLPQTSGLDYYYRLCNLPIVYPPQTIYETW